jgi:hypothetical protein
VLRSPDASRRPVGEFGPADDGVAGNNAPAARVTGHGSVVTQDEIPVLRAASPTAALLAAVRGPKVGLGKPGAVDEQVSRPHRDRLPGQPHDPFDERAANAAGSLDLGWRPENDDVASFGLVESVDESVGDDSIGDPRLAAVGRFGAVKGRLHGRGGDPIRLRDLRLKDEHRDRGQRDRQRPIDQRSESRRQARQRPVKKAHTRRVQVIERASHSCRRAGVRDSAGRRLMTVG